MFRDSVIRMNTSKDRDNRDNNNNNISYYLGAGGCTELRFLWSLPV